MSYVALVIEARHGELRRRALLLELQARELRQTVARRVLILGVLVIER